MDGLCDVVFKDSRDVFLIISCQTALENRKSRGPAAKKTTHLGEVSLGIADQQTRFSTSAVAHHDKLFRICWRLCDVGGLGHAATGDARVCADGSIADSHAVTASSRMPRSHRRGRRDEGMAACGRIKLIIAHRT